MQYHTRRGDTVVLRDVNFHVAEREFVCIVGPSGCGKTTLLRLVAELIQPSSGDIVFSNRTRADWSRIAIVFQDHGLLPWLTVFQNVAFGLRLLGIGRHECQSRTDAYIGKVGLASCADRYPYQLSIGMQQRVGIARALVTDPELLLMDEPFGSLDAQTKLIMQDELVQLLHANEKSVVFVTHDITEAVRLGDRVLVMADRPGHIREEIVVPLARPRASVFAKSREAEELERRIWSMLEDEVRKSLGIGE